jgi:hypothetical protein
MAIASVRKGLTASVSHWSDPRVVFWYTCSLVLAAYYGYLVLQSAFSAPYVVQDDARQHVFWMLRLVDPALFPGDFMADYFQSQAPQGYTWLYQTAASWGLHPLIFNKILPPLLSLLGTHYGFQLSLQILPVPAVAFTSTLLLNQSLWMRDDVVSGTPRAFFYVLLLAFLVYLNRRAIAPCLIVLSLQPWFYPHCALVSAGVLGVRLVRCQAGRLRWERDRRQLLLSGCGLMLVGLLLLPYVLDSSSFGPLITPAEARQMPEFWPGGRAAYFTNNPILFWFGDRSGFLPTPVLTPPMLAFSLLFPWLWWRSQHPWMSVIRSQATILQQLVVASFGLYFAAHVLLFTLHLPSRYTHHSLRIVFALAASFAIGICLDQLLHILAGAVTSPRTVLEKVGAVTTISLIGFGLFSYSALTQSFPFTNYRYGTLPTLYRFLRSTPKDTVIASLTKETSHLHVFAQRSPLIAPELGLPYHKGYYREFRQRIVELIQAQYSPDVANLQRFIDHYGIDYWLLDDQVLSAEYLQENDWFQQYQPAAAQAIAHLADSGTTPALVAAMPHCTVLETAPQWPKEIAPPPDAAQTYWLLDAACVRSRSLAAD